MQEPTSKSIDGITDLVVIAPIRDEFIAAYENVTFATRLKIVAEALNRVRVAAREHERLTPFSDVTERILTLLDFRIGILDRDLFAFAAGEQGMALKSRRFLYLTATFDGAWEPYMRLIWKPLGPFLDLLFCNCEGYVTASDHAFDEYAQWVRDHQVDSAIFYATTGLTVRDHLYLSQLERLQRSGASDRVLAELTMPAPELAAKLTRQQHLLKTIELGLEALTVLYRLADFYPPQWLTGTAGGLAGLNEGHLLAQVARDLLLGWDEITAWLQARPTEDPLRQLWERARIAYAEPLRWYETGCAYLETRTERTARRLPDPVFLAEEVQGGILKPQGSKDQLVQSGAMLLFTIRQAAEARRFVKALSVHFEAGEGSAPADGFFRQIGFTPDGLLRIGLPRDVLDRFPKEFRDGMAARSGLFGDLRENHPRNWILPERNGPVLTGEVPAGVPLPPVELREVDILIQIRSLHAKGALETEVRRLAALAAPGASLEAVEWLDAGYEPETGRFRDHFGFVDGISQPKPDLPPGAMGADRDRVAAGEILLGYGNDRGDGPASDYGDVGDWRAKHRRIALGLQRNGTYLVVRKIGQNAAALEAWAQTGSASINAAHPDLVTPMTPTRLKALVLGRDPDGTPLVTAGAGGLNDFDFHDDRVGRACPLASHIRRANPRPCEADRDHGRPAPRLMRRGMRFGTPDGPGPRGLMFMAYNASIAEQYEVIQRWLNGGNSTAIASANNDPLTGVRPKPALESAGDGRAPTLSSVGGFRFVQPGRNGPIAITVDLPTADPGAGATGAAEPGRHPFAPLYWGLYIFVPSRDALAQITALQTAHTPLRDPLEVAVGQKLIDGLAALDNEQAGREWKRLLEDFGAKDPSERDLSPSMLAAIRWRYGGVLDLRRASGEPGTIPVPVGLPALETPSGENWDEEPDRGSQNLVLCAGRRQVRRVLADWKLFTVEEQLRRIAPNSGPIFVTQQPDNQYRNRALAELGLDYAKESTRTNEVLLDYGEEPAFRVGYAAAAAVLDRAKQAAAESGRTSFKLELRRQFLLPALGGLCKAWYGLPDEKHMLAKGWGWNRIVAGAAADAVGSATRTVPHCPGDFLAPSRHAFYPRPSEQVAAFADDHGRAILRAAQAFVAEHRSAGGPAAAPVARDMFAAIDDDAVLARNLIGTMVGAIPPMDGNLRGVLLDWLLENSLWRHQAALRRAMAGERATADFERARAALYGPVSQAICKRPAPDLLYRTATGPGVIETSNGPVAVQERDLVVVSLVSAAHRSLLAGENDGNGDVSIVFGGQRRAAAQGYGEDALDDRYPAHACPAQKMAIGAMMGILAALLDSGTIQALPASLIVKISDWR